MTRMTRFAFLGLVLLEAQVDAVKRPHILIIVADDLGWNDVQWFAVPCQCYEHGFRRAVGSF